MDHVLSALFYQPYSKPLALSDRFTKCTEVRSTVEVSEVVLPKVLKMEDIL